MIVYRGAPGELVIDLTRDAAPDPDWPPPRRPPPERDPDEDMGLDPRTGLRLVSWEEMRRRRRSRA